MKKLNWLVLAAALFGALPSFAETDTKAMSYISDIRTGKDTARQIQTLRVKNNGTVGGNLVVTGTVTAQSTNLNSSADFTVNGNLTVNTNINVGVAGVVLTGDGDGALTILGAGNGSDENLIINLDDTANTAVISSGTSLNLITLSSIGLTVGQDLTVSGADIVGGNTDSINIGGTDATFKFIRNDAGTVTITSADNNADADLTVVAGGTGDVTVGDVTDSTVTIPIQTCVTEGTTSRICTSADYGKLVIVTNMAAVSVVLPANGAPAGASIEIATGGVADDTCIPTISAASADTLVGPNDIDLDSVTWGTGHRIGAHAKFWSDGSFWHVQNLGGTTMTYND